MGVQSGSGLQGYFLDMPDAQTEPPSMDHLAPKWLVDLWEQQQSWLRNSRVVAVIGGTIEDAPGGGKMIRLDGTFDLNLKDAFFGVNGVTRKGKLFAILDDE